MSRAFGTSALCLLLLSASAGATALSSSSSSAILVQDEEDAKPIERFEAWPKLASSDAKRVKRELTKLRKARTEEMGKSAMSTLKEFGPAVASDLIDVLGKEKNEDARARVIRVLDSVTDARATRLMAVAFDHKSLEVRRWALSRVASFPDKGVAAQAEAALARVAAQPDKKPDVEEFDQAAMCALSAGSRKGLSRAHSIAKDRWQRHATKLRSALEQVRTEEASAELIPELGEAERETKIVALRLLAGCGTKSATSKIGRLLDSSDNTLRVESINALRGIVDGDPPLLKLSAFEAVDRAKKWKGKL